MWMWGLRVARIISSAVWDWIQKLMKRLQEKASFFMCYFDFFLWAVFCGWCGFYERDGNDINRRLVYWNGMGGCSVFGEGWKNEMVEFVRFLVCLVFGGIYLSNIFWNKMYFSQIEAFGYYVIKIKKDKMR